MEMRAVLSVLVIFLWTSSISHAVEILEPGIIVVEPSYLPDAQGRKLSLSCVGYGEPYLPTITWTAQGPNGIVDFSNYAEADYNFNVSINTVIIEDTDTSLRFVLSVLELCDIDYRFYSMYENFQCHAVSNLSGISTIGSNYSEPVSLMPIVYEPASILAAPSTGEYLSNGLRLSATCVAYGSPQPDIYWTINNATIPENNLTNIYRTIVVDDDDDHLVLSTLEICNSMLQPTMGYVSCTARNGVTMGSDNVVQTVTFMVQPSIAIVSYSILILEESVAFTFIFSAPVTITEEDECFMNKITLRDGTEDDSASFIPMHSGICMEARASFSITTRLDQRDFISFLPFLTSPLSIFIQNVPGLENGFLPGYNLLPILSSSPLLVEEVIPSTFRPVLLSFDVDLNSNKLLLHFNGFMDVNSFNISFITLRSVRTSNFVSLSSRSVDAQSRYVKTACVSLSMEDRNAMIAGSVCTSSARDCSIGITRDLATGFAQNPVIPILGNFSVFHLNYSPQNMVRDLYMRVELQYFGCNTSYILTRDEVYSLREGETLTRIECVASGMGSNSNPVLSYQSLYSTGEIDPESVSTDWPQRTAIIFPTNFLRGRYFCNTLENKLSHYILDYNEDQSGHLFFPEGNSFNAQAYDNITIPFILGSIYPSLDSLDGLTLCSNDSNLQFRGISAYRGEFYFYLIQYYESGNYSFTLKSDDDVLLAEGYFYISVDIPSVEVLPPIALLLPTTTRTNLRCIPSIPNLPVRWSLTMGGASVGEIPELILGVPQTGFADGTEITCSVVDTSTKGRGRAIVSSSATVRNAPKPLTIFGNNTALESYQTIVKEDELTFQCIGMSSGNSTGRSVYWSIERNDESQIIREEINGMSISTSFGYNYANLIVRNQFVGTINCLYSDLGLQETVIVADSIPTDVRSCSESTDKIYNIVWEVAPVGFRDAKPCSLTTNKQGVEGIAFRRCRDNGSWEDMVDISECQTMRILELNSMAKAIFSDVGNISNESLSNSLSDITSSLVSATSPNEGSLFSQDLETTNSLVLGILTNLPLDTVQMGLIDVFNNLLDPTHEIGWTELNMRSAGSNQLLDNIEEFSTYLSKVQQDGKFTASRENIIVTSWKFPRTDYEDIFFPEESEEASKEGQVVISANLLRENSANRIANSFIRNLENLLPPRAEDESNQMVVLGSNVLSVQIFASAGKITSFGDKKIEFTYTTKSLPGAENPKCVFWNETENKWDSMNGITTEGVSIVDDGRNKSYQVNCSSTHATAFAVVTTISDVVTTESPVPFNFTVPVYVGCAAILFGAAVCIFFLFCSCILDSLRSYSIVVFLTHMSFCSSLICAFVAFWAGIELALVDERACITTAAALHYFFTAAFSWLLCEALVLVFYPWFSRHVWSFLIIFVTGWILPAVPTAIALGLLRDNYTTSTHCWFSFDGQVQNSIVLAFMVPKMVLILVTLILLVLGCVTTCYGSMNYQDGSQSALRTLLRIMWCGILILVALLSATWVFALLLVNGYGIDSVVTRWVFMGVSLGLALFMIAFFLLIAILNQRVYYDSDEEENQGNKTKVKRANYFEMETTTITETVEIIKNPVASDDASDDDDDDDQEITTTNVDDNFKEQKENLS